MGIGFEFGLRTGMRALALAVVSLALLGRPASADWRVYTSGDLGYSVSNGSAKNELQVGATLFTPGGSDTAVSPLIGGAVGLTVPMDEIAPVELPHWLGRPPDWDVRAELEAIGLREYKYSTNPIVANEGRVQTKVESWSLLANFSVDVPLRGLYRPISWTSARLFGRWRLRTLKILLDRTTFAPVVGIGVANLKANSEESVTQGSAEEYNFAWQAGAGFGYRLTDRVVMSLGYRYIDPGTAKYRARGGGVDSGFFKIDPEIHEARASVRVEVWDFASPWR